MSTGSPALPPGSPTATPTYARRSSASSARARAPGATAPSGPACACISEKCNWEKISIRQTLAARKLGIQRLLRQAEERVLPLPRLIECHGRGVHGQARRLPRVLSGRTDEAPPETDEPYGVPQEAWICLGGPGRRPHPITLDPVHVPKELLVLVDKVSHPFSKALNIDDLVCSKAQTALSRS